MSIEINGETSDGFHTFNDLYDHRMVLTAALFHALRRLSIGEVGAWPWRSVAHHPDDGPIYAGYFIVGAELDGQQFSYHYTLENWALFGMCTTLPHAPKWDGHTPADTIEILKRWARNPG